MPTIDIEVHCPVFDSFHVQQVGGMFDVPLAQRASQRFQVDVPEWLLETGGGRDAGEKSVERDAMAPETTAEQTKAEAEALVRSRLGSLPGVILRPSIIVGDSQTGVTSSFKMLYSPSRSTPEGCGALYRIPRCRAGYCSRGLRGKSRRAACLR